MKRKLKGYFRRAWIVNVVVIIGQILIFFISDNYDPKPCLAFILLYNVVGLSCYFIYYRGNKIDQLLALRYLNKMIKTEEHGPTMKKIMMINYDVENEKELEKSK